VQTWGYKNSQFDALLNEAAGTMDRQKRMAIYQKAAAAGKNDATYIWLFMFPYFIAHRDDVKPYDYTKFGDAVGNIFYFYDYIAPGSEGAPPGRWRTKTGPEAFV
jgi:ABC-type transport system substrate-binding protein